jgi:hypothetical protein
MKRKDILAAMRSTILVLRQLDHNHRYKANPDTAVPCVLWILNGGSIISGTESGRYLIFRERK